MPTFYPYVRKPAVGAAAFHRISEETSQSQAAVLLALGRQLRADDSRMAATTRAAGRPLPRSAFLGVSARAFPVPAVAPAPARVGGDAVRSQLRRRYNVRARTAAGGRWERAFGDCATALYKRPSLENAAQLLELSLQHPRLLVRIAAASTYHTVTSEPVRGVDTLLKGLASQDDLEKDLAATALARIDPGHDALRKLTRLRRLRARRRRTHTATMVHGTWAANGTWWRPAGDFYEFVRTFRSDLYSGNDLFRWTGGYSDGARAQAAQTLKQWVAGKGFAGLDLFAHSHGANAAMLATQLGMRAGKLILLSCPVHPHKYFPEFANTTRVISIRVKLDLVILADRGGQKFKHPKIEENVLPIWFIHSASHDPQVWQDHNVRAKI